jgi:hypothetical protein
LGAIARTTLEIKYKILTCDISYGTIEVFKSIAQAYRPCIEVLKHLRPVITIDDGFLSGYYKGRLLMIYGYDAENKLLRLAFEIVDEEHIEN